MNLYEHTIIARQDTSPSQIKSLKEKYSKLIQEYKGNLVQTQDWGLLNLSYLIKKNKKGNYIHFKIEGNGGLIKELEKNERIDKNLLRYVTIRVKKFDLNENYFTKEEVEELRKGKKKIDEK
jgi:small subunit ribosomal protein S6